LRLSPTHTIIPCCASSCHHKYCEPRQPFLTDCACGPEYVYSYTGYLRDGSKSTGLIIIASMVKPSRVFTCRNSGFEIRYSRNAVTSFVSITRTLEPSFRTSDTWGGV